MAAASWLSFFGCAVFLAVVAFFAVAVLAAGVVRVVFLDVVAGFCLLRAAMFVFPFVWGSRCSALATVANGTTQLPLVRKHIQRCVRLIQRTSSASKNGRNHAEPDRKITATRAHVCAATGSLAGPVDRSAEGRSFATLDLRRVDCRAFVPWVWPDSFGQNKELFASVDNLVFVPIVLSIEKTIDVDRSIVQYRLFLFLEWPI